MAPRTRIACWRGGSRGWALLVLLLALTSHAPAGAQEDLATRQLRNGDRLARDGKMDQALAAWRDVYDRYPDSAAAPAALDRLGSAAYPVERFDLRGQVAGEVLARARAFFEKIASDYRTSSEAPRAVFKLGLLFSDPEAEFFDLDEAYARFSTLITVYPASAYVDRAQFGLGEILVRQGECRRALIPLSRMLSERPDSGLADEAGYLLATCLARGGEQEGALRAYQAVRDQHPSSPRAPVARDRNTHLIRLRRAAGGDGGLYGRTGLITPGLSPEERIRGVNGLDVDEEGRLALVDGRADTVHVLDARGVPISRTAVRGPTAVWLDKGDLLVGAGGEVIQGGTRIILQSGGKEPVGEIAFLTRDSRGRLVVWDAKSGSIIRFGRAGAFDRILLPGREHRIVAVTGGDDGSIYALDGKEQTIIHLSGDSEPRTIELHGEGQLGRPDALAVDFLGNLFVMDTTAREIVVLDGSGKFLKRITSGRGSEDAFPRPVGLAVNGKGEILVYDLRREGIVVIR